MTNICTKVTLRKRPVTNGQQSLYLDYYPAIRNPKTRRMTRREYLGIYIYAHPRQEFEEAFNRSMLAKAEIIRCRRTEMVINEQYGFLDKSMRGASFLDYFQSAIRGKSHFWQLAYNHLSNYVQGRCAFKDLNEPLCRGFITYLQEIRTPASRSEDKRLNPATVRTYAIAMRAVLRKAYNERLTKDDFSLCIEKPKEKPAKRGFLTLDELRCLAATPCKYPALRRVFLFSCLTGLRRSDCMALRWENIIRDNSGQWVMRLRIKKTDTDAVLPLGTEALALCGERGTGTVFKDFRVWMASYPLKDWLKAAGITKPICFHCARHTFATLQVSLGTDIYTVSKLLTHSSVTTTQIYADVVSEKKREAAERLTLHIADTASNSGNGV